MVPSSTATTPLGPGISVRNLSLSYAGRTVLHDVNLDMAAGRITAVIGPSGCGKTSFLWCLNRLTDLIPHCKVTGEARIGGMEVFHAQTDVMTLRRKVGLIFQKPNPFPMSIRRNLELPLKEHGCRNREERAHRIESALREVGLWDEVKDRMTRSALELSGGQQQRLCLARCLVLNPEVVLLDEPCSALDPLATRVVEELILDLKARFTIVVVTHNLAQARRLAEDVAVFWSENGQGQIIEQGSIKEVFSQPKHALTAGYIRGDWG
jgi:phosphate transport system ATP-binding protein